MTTNQLKSRNDRFQALSNGITRQYLRLRHATTNEHALENTQQRRRTVDDELDSTQSCTVAARMFLEELKDKKKKKKNERLPSALRLRTTHECMHLVTHNHYWSCDTDSGHTN